MTYGDYIRSISDEELAHEILVWVVSNRTTFDEDCLEKFILHYIKEPYDGMKEDF